MDAVVSYYLIFPHVSCFFRTQETRSDWFIFLRSGGGDSSFRLVEEVIFSDLLNLSVFRGGEVVLPEPSCSLSGFVSGV